MSYTETLTIRTRDCDLFGCWKPSAMLEAMQEVAISHCEGVGLGRNVTDDHGVVWVLSRCRVELSMTPKNGESISLETFALPMKHLFFPRGHVFRDAQGKIIGGAHGLWLLMDIHTRKIVREPFIVEHLPFETMEAPTAMPATVKPVEGRASISEFTPQFTDFDINGHVNNARYMDWCWNALGLQELKDRALSRLDINYDAEILPGEHVRAELCQDESGFSYLGYSKDRLCFGIRGSWKSP